MPSYIYISSQTPAGKGTEYCYPFLPDSRTSYTLLYSASGWLWHSAPGRLILTKTKHQSYQHQKLRVNGITDSESVPSSTNSGLVLGSIVTMFSVLVTGRVEASIMTPSVLVPQRRPSFDPIEGLLYEMVGEL